MKKLLLLVLVSVIFMLAFTSCTVAFKDMIPTPEDTEHHHAFGEAWESDALIHFHKCTCGEKSAVAAHSDDNADNICDVCTYALPKALDTFVLTVATVDADGNFLFGTSYNVTEGAEVSFTLMVGVEYTLASEVLTEVENIAENGVRTYTFKHAALTEDATVTVVATLCAHSFVDATCTAPKTCELCTFEDGEPLGHDWIDADCVTSKTCATCGAIDGDPLGHTPGDWIVDDDATCTTDGTHHKECQTCGAVTKTESIPATGHKDENEDLSCDNCSEPV